MYGILILPMCTSSSSHGGAIQTSDLMGVTVDGMFKIRNGTSISISFFPFLWVVAAMQKFEVAAIYDQKAFWGIRSSIGITIDGATLY